MNLFLFLQIVNSNAENVGADKTISSLNENQQVVTADDVHITITNNGSVERTGQKAIKNTDSETLRKLSLNQAAILSTLQAVSSQNDDIKKRFEEQQDKISFP